jgi:hypothetical protein
MSYGNAPDDTHRAIILGRTGSGKTQCACHLLSSRDFDEKPWTILDYKGDPFISQIVRANNLKEITPDKPPPTKPGLYRMKLRPHIDDNAVERWLYKVWENEKHGLYVDEGYALPQRAAFDIVLTQGRSKHIPIIALYQRPVWMSRFAIAQADFVGVFDQFDERDIKTTQTFVKPYKSKELGTISLYDELPPYYFHWFNVAAKQTTIMRPVPRSKEILATFKERLTKAQHKRIGEMV